MSGIQQVYVPQVRTRICVSIEGVSAVMLCGHEDSVPDLGADTQAGHPQRLSVGCAIHRTGKQLPEGGCLYAACSERVFLRVCAVAGEVIVVGNNPGQVRNGNRRGGTLRSIYRARCPNCVRPRSSRRSIDTAYTDRADCGVPTSHSIYAPTHAVCWITGRRRFELHRLGDGHNGGANGTYVHRGDLGASTAGTAAP